MPLWLKTIAVLVLVLALADWGGDLWQIFIFVPLALVLWVGWISLYEMLFERTNEESSALGTIFFTAWLLAGVFLLAKLNLVLIAF